MSAWTALFSFFVLEYLGTMVFSMYCHRQLAHKHWTLHPALNHFCRFYLWFIGGYGSWPNWQQQYAAQHRKHHRLSDRPGDPISPYQFSARELFFNCSNTDANGPYWLTPDEVKKGAPDIISDNDWLQKNIYCRRNLGKILFALMLFYLFGWLGLILGIINFIFIDWYGIAIGTYIVHKWGWKPKNRKSADQSKNSYPWCFFMAGEELHANHHDQPYNPNNSRHWYEIDATFCVAKFLSFFGLVHFIKRQS